MKPRTAAPLQWPNRAVVQWALAQIRWFQNREEVAKKERGRSPSTALREQMAETASS
jgi:hypothetical protein